MHGETPLASVTGVLALMDREAGLAAGQSDAVFVDVGCGRGHVVFAAAADRAWRRCVGIELEQAHVDEASRALAELARLEGSNERLAVSCLLCFKLRGD